MLAAFKLRAVPVNVNYRYVEDELRYLLDDADAKAIVFHREFAPKLAAVRADAPAARRRSSWSTTTHGATVTEPSLDAADYEAALAGRVTRHATSGPRSPDDLYILYTGGTTGMPKGVMWRAEDIFFGAFGGGNLGDDADHHARGGHRRASTAVAACLPACPFMHGTAHWMALRHALLGRHASSISPDRHFDPAHLWRSIAARAGDVPRDRRRRVRPAAGRGARRRSTPPPDVSALTVVLSGGAILSPSVKAAWVDRLPGTLLIDGFGASETGGQGQSVSAAGGRIETAAALRGERRDHRARRRPPPASGPAWSASSPAAATSRSGTTRTRRRPRPRSR